MTKLTKKFIEEKIGFAWSDDMTAVEKMQWENKAFNFACDQTRDSITFSGSEKQIAWAQSIFKSKLFEALMQDNTIAIPAIIRAFEKVAKEHLEASWWIDHRSCRTSEIVGKETLKDIRAKVDELEDQSPEAAWNYMINSWEV